MSESFIDKVQQIILKNLPDERFGVSELAAESGMSRSQVLRKIKSTTGKSANQYIREIRLEEALKLLKNSDLTASEISYKVGFSSPSYFNKCFLDHYGLTPGEFKKKAADGDPYEINSETKSVNRKIPKPAFVTVLVIIVAVATYFTVVHPKNEPSFQQASIAVLPFSDYSEKKNQEYLADGITEILTRDLSKVRELRVPSRTSSMKYKNEKKLSTQIARELNVKLILEGSVFRKEDSILITVQLVRAIPEEKHIWAESYATSPEDFYRLIDRISSEIVSNISSALKTGERKESIARVDPEANDLYLRGRHLYNTQKTRYNSLLKAVDYIEEAISIDPDFAPAYVTLAECYLAINFLILDNEEKFINRDHARSAIDKALFLDNTFAEAYITKGNLAGKFDWDWEMMKELAEKGLELEPSNANAHVILSNYYVVKGDYKSAVEEALKAESLDPINPSIGCFVAERYYISEDYERSIEKYNKVLELNPNYGFAYNGIGFAYFKAGMDDKAIEAWQTLQGIMGNEALGKCYDDHFYKECFQFYLENAKKSEPRFCSNPVIISSIHMLLDEKSGAMEYLDIALRFKNEDLPVMLAYPDFYALHQNSRFKELAQTVGVVIPK